MRLHVCSLPHTETTTGYPTCAYTGKVYRFGKMMMPLGHEVILYAGEENTAECTEHVPLVTREERVRWFGEHDQNGLWGNLHLVPSDEPWQIMNSRAVEEIGKRLDSKHDLLLLGMGFSHQPIANALPRQTACEPFVGYEGVSTKFRAFESHFWRAHIYGRNRIDDGDWYDTVCPNYFDPDDFYAVKKPDDYLLFVGRVTVRKNPHVAAMIAGALGMKLIVAGPGVTHVEPGRIVADHIELLGDHVEYVGPVGIEERAKLMAHARALIAPTAFLEPFGGVAVEAMLCGTPVVASDWGAFTETVVPGLSGYRFSTLAEGVERTRLALKLNRKKIREYALSRYTLAAVAPQFDRWFHQLDGLWDGGWDTLEPQPDVPLTA